MIILGSLVRIDGSESDTFLHRITQAWKVFWKWKNVFFSNASLKHKLAFWDKTVGASILWGLETTRPDRKSHDALQHAQRFMIIKMLGQKRIRYHDASLELWLDFHKRRYRKAKEIVQGYNVDIVALLRKKRLSYAKHLARMGMDMNETHLIKLLVLWRNLEWWRKQQHQLMIGGSDSGIQRMER